MLRESYAFQELNFRMNENRGFTTNPFKGRCPEEYRLRTWNTIFHF